MPFQGKFYKVSELQKILAKDGEPITRQAIFGLAKYHDWLSFQPGSYCAEQVEPYLWLRNIDPALLPVKTFHGEYEKEMEIEE